MADHINIGGLAFEVRPVPAKTAEAVLRDPLPAQAVWRKVWSWDGSRDRRMVAMTPENAVPLPNALVFFRPKATAEGVVASDGKSAARMRERFLEAVGAPDLETVLKKLAEILMAPRKGLPLEVYAPLRDVAAYTIRQHTDFAVLELRQAEADLTVYLCLPNRVSYHHETTRILDEAGFAALMQARPELRTLQPSFAVPARSVASRRLRQLALAQREAEVTAAMAALPAGVGGDVARTNLDAARDLLRADRAALAGTHEKRK